jgi:hypothetical protein
LRRGFADTRRNRRRLVIPSLDQPRTCGLKLSTTGITTARHLQYPLNAHHSTFTVEAPRQWPQNSAPLPRLTLLPQPPVPRHPYDQPKPKQTTQTQQPLRKEYGINTSPRHPSEQSFSTPSLRSSLSSVLYNSSM